jgi:hypothetical protein
MIEAKDTISWRKKERLIDGNIIAVGCVGLGEKIERDPFSLQNNSIARNICVRKEEDQTSLIKNQNFINMHVIRLIEP